MTMNMMMNMMKMEAVLPVVHSFTSISVHYHTSFCFTLLCLNISIYFQYHTI